MRIALLTCNKLPDLLPADQLLIPRLALRGIHAVAVVWDDRRIDWKSFDFLIFRNTWDYYEKETEFNHWLDWLETNGIKTLNSISVVRENKHKFYLRELNRKGIQILPTIFIDKTSQLRLAAMIPPEWKMAVIKPAFSAGSYLTECFKIDDIEEVNSRYKTIAESKDMLLQEFRPEIQTLGETSFIFFNKKFSHCVNKKPASGDFRVQFQFGGEYELVNPDQSLIDQAKKVVDEYSEILYARVDGIVIDGKLFLMEIECIEPDLYLNLEENAYDIFVDEIVAMTTK